MIVTKILQVVTSLHPSWGGPAQVVNDISSKLTERGHQVTIYSTDIKGKSIHPTLNPAVEVQLFSSIKLLSRFNIYPTMGMIKPLKVEMQEFDIIHLHEYRTFQNVLIQFLSKLTRTKYVIQTHGSLPSVLSLHGLKRLFDSLFGTRIIRDATRLIALSSEEEAQFERFKVDVKKIDRIPNGLNLKAYTQLPCKGNFRTRYQIRKGEKIVLFLGRIHEIKGVDFLVKAFSNVIKKFSNVRLVIVGPDDGYLSTIRKLIHSLGIENQILITEPLYGTAKFEVLVDADLFIQPSRYEMFPLGLLEAMVCRNPVIVSKVGVLKEIIRDQVNGLTFNVGDISQLTDAMLKLLDDEEVAQKYAMEGHQFVIKNFGIENTIDRLEKTYYKALEE